MKTQPLPNKPDDWLIAVRNDEFMLFRDGTGRLWAFPRGHLVSAKIKEKVYCEFNFRTHLVIIGGGTDCRDWFDALLEGKVSIVAAGPLPITADHIRQVSRVDVRQNAMN